MSVPIWSTPAGDLGTIPELNYFAVGLQAYDSQDPARPVSFELVAGTAPAGIHVDGYGLIAGSPEISTKNIKEATSKFAVRARSADYFEEIINDGATFTLTNPVPVTINRIVAIINGTEILPATFEKSETNMFTVTLSRMLTAGETVAVYLYGSADPAPDYQEQFTGDGSTTEYIMSDLIGPAIARVVTLMNGNTILASTFTKTITGIFTITLAQPLGVGEILTAKLYQLAAQVSSYTESFSLINTKLKYVLSNYIDFDVHRVLAVSNSSEIRYCTFKRTSVGVVTITLDKVIETGESLVISLYQTGTAVADRTFTITVVGENPPTILKYDPLGTYFDGQFVDIDITALDLDPDDTLTWDLTAGRLPNGITLDRTTGKISGYIVPFYVSGSEASIINSVGLDSAPYDSYVYDDTSPTTEYFSITSPGTDVFVKYQFSVSVSDGKYSDTKSYNLRIISSSDVIVSSDQITVDSTLFTADQKKVYSPLMLDAPGEIGPFQHDNYFLYKFDAVDYNGDKLEYYIDNQTEIGLDSNLLDSVPYDPSGIGLPSYLTLDADTGWLRGTVPVMTELETVYKFNVRARKKTIHDTALDGSTIRYYTSRRQQYQLTVLGRLENTVTWTTGQNLGSVDNGEVSELYIAATSTTESPVYYELLEGSRSRLPQGLKLLDDGLIVGKTTFSTFECDGGTTTYDKNDFNIDETTIDQTFQFTVRVFDVNNIDPDTVSPSVTGIATDGLVTVAASGTFVTGQLFNITDMRVTTFTGVTVFDATGRISFSALATAPAAGIAVYVSGTNSGNATGISAGTYYIASSPPPTTSEATLITTAPGTTPVGVLTTSGTTTTGLAFKTNGSPIGFAPGVYYVVAGAYDGDFYFTRSITGTAFKLATSYSNAMAETPIPITVTKTCVVSNSVVVTTPNITYIQTTGEATVTYGTYLRGQRFHVIAVTAGAGPSAAVGFTTGDYYVIDDVTGTEITLSSSYPNARHRIPITSVTKSGTLESSTVEISSVYQTVDSTREFTLRLNKAHNKPCDDLYMQSRLQKDSRDYLNTNILLNSDVIPPEDLYRANDSFFGVTKHLRLLIANGVNPTTAADYVSILARAHYTKPLYFGDIKTARALNPDNSVRYEVVYLDVLDNLKGADGQNVSTAIDAIPNKIKLTIDSQYVLSDSAITIDGISKLYPNNLVNMRRIVIRGLGQVNKALPDWMVDTQADGSVLGFTTGCVLAYVAPGAAEKIAFRIREKIANLGYSFTDLNVVIDRYVWDNNLSANYDRAEDRFYSEKPTTFDMYSQSYTPDFDSEGTPIYPTSMWPVSFVDPILSPDGITYEYPYNQYVNNPLSFPIVAKTTFDGGSVNFFAYRDEYAAQDQGDAYLKFPRLHIYHTQNTK